MEINIEIQRPVVITSPSLVPSLCQVPQLVWWTVGDLIGRFLYLLAPWFFRGWWMRLEWDGVTSGGKWEWIAIGMDSD